MNNFHRSKTTVCLYVLFPVGVFLITSLLAGCEPLRKKFSRKKKESIQEEVIPVLEPIEYPARIHSSEEIYRHRYSLWQVWHKDLMTALQEKESDKSVIYILNELLTQVAEMQKVVGEKTKAGLERVQEDLRQINAEYKKSANLRNMVIITNKLIRLDKQLRQQYSPIDVKDDFK